MKGKSISQLPDGWGRQGTFYKDAQAGCEVGFLVLVPLKKSTKAETWMLPDEEVPRWRQQLIDGERAVTKALSIQDTNALAAVCMPDPGHYSADDLQPILDEVWRERIERAS